MKKRILSILLTLVMVIGMLPATALAATDFAVTGAYVGSSATNKSWVKADAATASLLLSKRPHFG